MYVYMAARTRVSLCGCAGREGRIRKQAQMRPGQPPRHTQMCSSERVAHMHAANSWLTQAPVHTHVHTRAPSGPHSLHTVSGRFLSLSSLRSKHWLIMGFSELHMVCEGKAGGSGHRRRRDLFLGQRSVSAQPPVPLPSLSHLLQVPEEKVIVFIQKAWEGGADTR